MSQPPPSPYDGPPAPVNPYGPATRQPEPGAPRPGMTNRAKFWIGFVLSLPVSFVATLALSAAGAAGTALGGDNDAVSGVTAGILALGLLAGLIAGIVVEKTRRFALGILAGTVVMMVLAAIAIVLFLVALANSLS